MGAKMCSEKQIDLNEILRSFEPGKSKGFMVKLPEELYNALKAYSSEKGLSMSYVVRSCIADLFRKGELGNVKRFFDHF